MVGDACHEAILAAALHLNDIFNALMQSLENPKGNLGKSHTVLLL